MSLVEKISVINSAVRTLLATVLVGGIGLGGWYGYQRINERELAARRSAEALAAAEEKLARASSEISTLNQEVATQREQIQRLDTALRLLKVDKRIATLSVLDQRLDDNHNVVSSTLEFQELNEHGDPIGSAKRFTIEGDLVYVDSWVVKFEDRYVEQADLLRGTSLVLFRRVFGEKQAPDSGFVLDQEGTRPAAYAGSGEISEFERKIWNDFWNVADDETKQAELGIRAMHAEAPSFRVKQGRRYRITRRASAGLTFENDGQIETPPVPAT